MRCGSAQEDQWQYGYYAFLVLLGDRFIVRIELRIYLTLQRSEILNYWSEPGIPASKGCKKRIAAELRSLVGI